MHHHQSVIGNSEVQKTGCAAIGTCIKVKPFVDLVGQNPGAGAAAMVQNALLLLARQRPASRVIRRVDNQQLGFRRHGHQQRFDVKLPLPVVGLQGHATQASTHDRSLGSQVGPDRGDGHHLIARIDQGLCCEHQGVHAATGDGQSVKLDGAMTLGHVMRHSLAQFGQAQVVRIKGLAHLQGGDGGLSNRLGRDLVAFAKPESQQIGSPQTGIGNLPDAGLREIKDGLAHTKFLKKCDQSSPWMVLGWPAQESGPICVKSSFFKPRAQIINMWHFA